MNLENILINSLIFKCLGVEFNTYYNLINNNLFYDKNFIRLPYLREFIE